MSGRPMELAKKWFNTANASRKQWMNVREAKRALSVLERDGRALPQKTRKQAREDACERLGAQRHEHWLMVYAAVAGRFHDGWIPESYYLEHVMPRINGVSHHLGRVQATNAVLMERDVLPDILYILNGRLLGRRLESLSEQEAWQRIQDSGSEVVFKADSSGFGQGVRTVRTADFEVRDLRQLGNGVIQMKVRGHDVFDQFGMEALATLRLGTSLPSTAEPKIRNCYLKIGRANQNHVVACNQVRVAVDWRTGDLDSRGFLSDWQVVDRHPDAGATFANIKLPGIERAVQTVLKLHSAMPFARYVSWDLAIDRLGEIQVLEWEGGVVSFAEAVQGPCFADTAWARLHLHGVTAFAADGMTNAETKGYNPSAESVRSR